MEALRGIGTSLLCLGACFGPLLLIGYGIPILSYTSRRRNARRKKRTDRQHASKFPYRWVAYLFLGITVLTAGLVLYWFISGTFELSQDSLEACGAIIVIPLIVSIVAFRSYILQRMPSAAEALQKDSRPPVLYLRSFDQESLKFVDLKDEEKKKYNNFLNYAEDVHLPPFEQKLYDLMNRSAILVADAPVNGEDITFEKYFRPEVMQRIGPLVALGNPVDDLPAEGAYRDYQIDDRWKDVFYERAAQSACILMQLGNSNNLQFELTSILARGMRQKLFILTPPQADVKDKNAWIRKYILREKPATWETFSTILKNNGYQVLEGQLGIGSVLTFEPDGRPILLVQGAFEPGEYILPIYTRLKELKILPAG